MKGLKRSESRYIITNKRYILLYNSSTYLFVSDNPFDDFLERRTGTVLHSQDGNFDDGESGHGVLLFVRLF